MPVTNSEARSFKIVARALMWNKRVGRMLEEKTSLITSQRSMWEASSGRRFCRFNCHWCRRSEAPPTFLSSSEQQWAST
jgi:hypothetical protein